MGKRMRASKNMPKNKGKSVEDPSYIYNPKKKKAPEELKCPKWTPQQNEAYIDFLLDNLSILEQKEGRKARCFFKNMSESMGGVKNNEQCRSHHQKMMKHYGNVRSIIDHFRPEIRPQEIDETKEESWEMEVNGHLID